MSKSKQKPFLNTFNKSDRKWFLMRNLTFVDVMPVRLNAATSLRLISVKLAGGRKALRGFTSEDHLSNYLFIITYEKTS
jgi:hypothetical protein